MIYTYEQYCADLNYFDKINDYDLLSESIVDVLSGIRGKVGKFLLDAKDIFAEIFDETSLTVKDLIHAFKTKDFFAILKQFGFSAKTMLKNIQKAVGLMNKGLRSVLEGIHENSALMQQLQKGGKALDDFLAKHPILKKLTGPIIAGLLMYTWLNMTFIGDFDYDMDISAMFAALGGSFSVHDLFTSPQGNVMLLLLATGLLSGGVISVAWLGSTAANLVAAISYVFLKKVKSDPTALNKLKKQILKR